jgi:hypothetical protein
LCSPAAQPKRLLKRVAALIVAAVSRNLRRFMAWKLMIASSKGDPRERKSNPGALYAVDEISVVKRYCRSWDVVETQQKRDAEASLLPKSRPLGLLHLKIISDLEGTRN